VFNRVHTVVCEACYMVTWCVCSTDRRRWWSVVSNCERSDDSASSWTVSSTDCRSLWRRLYTDWDRQPHHQRTAQRRPRHGL